MDRTVSKGMFICFLVIATAIAGCEQETTTENITAGLIASPEQNEPLQDLSTDGEPEVDLPGETQVEAVNAAPNTESDEIAELGDEDEDDELALEADEESEVDIEQFEEVEEDGSADPRSNVAFMQLSEDGDVVSFVEIDRYMGRWYEIATTPSFQQAACFGTTADYVFNEDMGWVDVTNGCFSGSLEGNLQQIKGRAEIDDEDTQAKLFVIFFGQSAPYWVVALDGSKGDQPYEWAVVSVPGGQTMWLLSRTKTIDPLLRETIEAHLTDRGFDVSRLIDTTHAD